MAYQIGATRIRLPAARTVKAGGAAAAVPMGPSGDGMLRAVVHIQEHLDEPLDIQCLAGVARYSPWHFHRACRGMVGEPVMEHVRRLRLELASWNIARPSTRGGPSGRRSTPLGR